MTLKFAICLPSVKTPPSLGGGFLNTVRFGKLLSNVVETIFVSYQKKEEGVIYLPEKWEELRDQGYCLIILWGPDVPSLIKAYEGKMKLIYYVKSQDNNIVLPSGTPVFCNSRYLMGYAQQQWSGSPLFYLPPVLEKQFKNEHKERDIDVLVIKRKMPAYILEEVVPALKKKRKVHVQEAFIERTELAELYNRAKVYLYAFAPQKIDVVPGYRFMEGMGTQALEAMACGCTVFSNLRGGMIDFIEPGRSGYQLEVHSPEWEINQILKKVEAYQGESEEAAYYRNHYAEEAFFARVKNMLSTLEQYMKYQEQHAEAVSTFGMQAPLSSFELWKERVRKKIKAPFRKLI